MKKPELLAPGGSFLSAYYAFEAGADGVYLGMREFSARAAARNFSWDQLRRIRRLAADRGRRIYVTLNTIVRESEMPRLRETLGWLDALGVDGVIVQDFGVLETARTLFPRLPIHASTQMAVHNDSGLSVAERMGVRRVILSRELPLARIRELRADHPGIELEVFIHGALCYGFSGMCLASWALTGRSGNRGECAQICRSLFRGDTKDCREGHFFSCRDLFVGREVLELARAGIDSLKIEGRMKSPEYVYNVTRLYRAILDQGGDLGDAAYADLVRRAETSFSRQKTTAWLHAPAATRLIEARYPGHRGALLGVVDALQGREMCLRLAADLSLHDGIAYFVPLQREPVAFSVGRIRVGGRETSFARAGDMASIELPLESGAIPPTRGTEVRHLSSRFLDLPQPKEAGFPLFKMGRECAVTMTPSEIQVNVVGMPSFSQPITVDRATRRKPFQPILAGLLTESGESLFTVTAISLANETGMADDEIFVPPAELKKAKNALYTFLDEAFMDSLARLRAGGSPPTLQGPSDLIGGDAWRSLSHRERLSPPGNEPLPFVGPGPSDVGLGGFADYLGFRWIPLPPVMMEEEGWEQALAGLVDAHPEIRFAVGLNNIGHLEIAAGFADRENVFFFADYLLYVANGEACATLERGFKRFLFAYRWIEDEEIPSDELPLVTIAEGFRPPLFYSLGCFARHDLNNGVCFEECPKEFSREIVQGPNRFRVLTRDCVSYLIATEGRKGAE